MDPSHARPRGRVAALLSVFAKHLGANVIRVDAEDLPPSIAPLVETKNRINGMDDCEKIDHVPIALANIDGTERRCGRRSRDRMRTSPHGDGPDQRPRGSPDPLR